MMEKTTIPYDTMSVKSIGTEPMFSKCCCCIPLRIGCFILGYINLFVNSTRTMSVVGATLFYGLKTHGFDHVDSLPSANDIENRPSAFDTKMATLDPKTIQILGWTLLVILIFDLIWLVVNIACLVGIHKKRPGPIRTYVGFAICRLVFTLAGYMYQAHTFEGNNSYVIEHCIDLGLTTYFIFVYYIYAMRLEKEALEVAAQLQVNDVAYIYPTKLDKEHLVV